MSKTKNKLADITPQELERLVNVVQQLDLSDADKNLLSTIIGHVEKLIEMLRSSKVNIHKLQQMLGFRSELLKKLQQTQA